MHFTQLPLYKELAPLLENSMYFAVSSACFSNEWNQLEKLTREHRFIQAAYGIHPSEASAFYESHWKLCLDFILRNPQSKIGETGLDKRVPFYKGNDFQEKLFVLQAKAALQFKRDLIIHCVGDYTRIFKLLRSLGYPQKESNIVLHRFYPKKHLLQDTLNLDCQLSLHKDSFRSPDLALFLKEIPQEKFKVETDADINFVSPNSRPEEIALKLKNEIHETNQLFLAALESFQRL
jgi:TatD DNase family protein